MMTEKSSYTLSSYVTTAYGVSSGSYSCSSNINGTITNTSSLSKGVHTITCTIKSNSGLTNTDSVNLAVVNSAFVRNTANEKLVTMTADGDRDFYKTNSILALAGLYYNYDGASEWFGPILVSNIDPTATNHHVRNNHTSNTTGYYTFDYLGITWYVSYSNTFYPPSAISAIETSLITISSDNFEGSYQIDAAKSLIDLALKDLDTSQPTAPTVTGGSTSWSPTAKTISVSTASTVSSGISYYQYYVSTSSSSQTGGSWIDLPPRTTNVSISTNGTRYIFFRAISNTGIAGKVSASQTTKIDTTTPSITLNSNLLSSITRGDNYKIIDSYTANGPSGGSASCSSNLDGTITNINQLTTLGNHNIACTVRTGAGKTNTVTKSVEITYAPYIANNIIINSGIEDEDISKYRCISLNTISRNNTIKYSGDYSLSFYLNTETIGYVGNLQQDGIVTLKEGHIYYASEMVYPEKIGSSNWDGEFDMYRLEGTTIGYLEYGNKNLHHLSAGNWSKLSFLFTSTVTYSYNFRLAYFITQEANVDLRFYFDNLILIDLTETFGAENEPSQEWCDKHINYFDGTATIYK